jgi:CRISPR-associated protein Csb2
VFAELARLPPQFFLPPATLGHTRHYMPWFKKGPEDKTLVFDAFVSLAPDAEVVCHWPDSSLLPEGQDALALILDQLSYFGRAESWADARLLTDFDSARVNCRPEHIQTGEESVRVLTVHPQKWQEWDFTDKKIPRPDPLWNLLAETADMHREKWSDPPGSKWETYARPADAFAPKPASRRQRPVVATNYTVARYAVDVAWGRRPLPLVTDTLPLAEAVRRALLSKCAGLLRRRGMEADKEEPRKDSLHPSSFIPHPCGRVLSERCPALVGKDALGRPLRDDHAHAFFLPADEDGDGRIDHVTIFAARGFGADEVQALDRLRQLRWGDGDPLRLLLVGLGTPRDFAAAPLFAPSAVWRSATPFVVTRYPKRRGTKRDRPEDYASPHAFAGHVLRQEVERRPELPAVVSIDEEPWIGPHRLRTTQFQRFRDKPGDDGGRRPAAGFRLTFAAPILGPLCLGHACHFGLGLFLPSPSPTAVREPR